MARNWRRERGLSFHPDETSAAPFPSPRKADETALGLLRFIRRSQMRGFFSRQRRSSLRAPPLPRFRPRPRTRSRHRSCWRAPLSPAISAPRCRLLMEQLDAKSREERRRHQEEGKSPNGSCCDAGSCIYFILTIYVVCDIIYVKVNPF